MTTNTIAMHGVRRVDVLSGHAAGGAVRCSADAPVLPAWRVRVIEGGFAPIAASVEYKPNSTRVSVPGCRGAT